MQPRCRTLRIVGAGALAALALAGCGSDDRPAAGDTDTTTGDGAPYPTETDDTAATTGSTTTPDATAPRQVVIVVAGGRPRGGIRQIEAEQGERLVIIVRADAGESLHLHGYDLERPVRPGRPTRMPLRATIPGRFELELHHPDALLARLTVRP